MPSASTAGYYNPSALSAVSRCSAEFMHASHFDNLYSYDFLSFAAPLKNGMGGSVTALYTRVGDIPLTTLTDPSQPISDDNRVIIESETGDHEFALLASAGREIGKGWKGGATGKLLSKSVAGESAFGLGVDVGLSRTIAKRLEVGVAARDISSSVLAWSTGRTETILPTVIGGVQWSIGIPAMDAQIALAADLEARFESRGKAEVISAGPLSLEPRLGMEYLISKTVALRAGVHGEQWTAGAGLLFGAVAVHAAFEDHQDLGLTHRVSLALNL
jgi:hypothetical protein